MSMYHARAAGADRCGGAHPAPAGTTAPAPPGPAPTTAATAAYDQSDVDGAMLARPLPQA
jgi:hypothetical protein